MPEQDLAVEAFRALRAAFFERTGVPVPFPLRPKRNTQDDPFDEYVAKVLGQKLPRVTCARAPGPLITPDLVLMRKRLCEGASRATLAKDLDRIVAIEVKKLERGTSGAIARPSGMDYNTTPPCGLVRVYGQDGQPLDIRSFYLFVCQEPAKRRGHKTLSSLVLCDGNALNADFDYYLSVVGERTKRVDLGTYGNGADRTRPMVIFGNPLGCPALDHHVTLVHPRPDLATAPAPMRLAHVLKRTRTDGTVADFFCFRWGTDVPDGWEVTTLRDPFPVPHRVRRTQRRGRFRLAIQPAD